MTLTKKIISALALCCLLLSHYTTMAQISDNHAKDNQPLENSPLSRLGFGNITPQYFANGEAMGGLTAAFRSPVTTNMANPASLAFLRTAVYELALYAKSSTVSNKGVSVDGWSGNLGYLSLAFPTYSTINEVLDRKPRTLRWAMGFSLAPYNSVGYNVSTTTKHPTIDSASVISYFLGSGGTYQLKWGNAVEYKNLALGINLGYVFGKIANDRQVFLSNLGTHYADVLNTDYQVTGFTYSLGAQYDLKLDKDFVDKPAQRHLVLGIYGNSANGFNTSLNTLTSRYLSDGFSTSTVANDTLQNTQDAKGKGTLPAEIVIGAQYEYGSKWKVGAQYAATNWSAYRNEAYAQTLLNSSLLNVGMEYIPDALNYKNFTKRIRYRLGAKVGSDPRQIGGVQASVWAVTGGFGLPIVLPREQVSFVNFTFEYGNVGIKNSLNESYFKMTAGFTLNDNSWFLKKKFN